eukprot:COSAG02_NODE_31_length_50774_cov_1928.118204_15_plen_118_part_00
MHLTFVTAGNRTADTESSGCSAYEYRSAASSASYSTFALGQDLLQNVSPVVLVQLRPAGGGPTYSSRRWRQPQERDVVVAGPAWAQWPAPDISTCCVSSHVAAATSVCHAGEVHVCL